MDRGALVGKMVYLSSDQFNLAIMTMHRSSRQKVVLGVNFQNLEVVYMHIVLHVLAKCRLVAMKSLYRIENSVEVVNSLE
jgi:hypothetical protein